ncbi:ATP-binding cassette domain-containing protein [Microbacterium sp.]|uniref:ABC transporter ATP-binding protein n=1 Tax=Microbacterium sp. TaxID=51671 RepID=UPI000928F6C8|nr:ATP-binding cassette domain-containing protein [Microbacterium sp.]MBN9187399.1 ABC transporter ATP-binding protein [Microbacterium sp.]MBN9193904.1 ABC transporter ATP-binding protein [Microbacterium sp.]OJU70124.1 MAG: peptide ABC transporter ATP-binding protein [Microbacterium sp. 70-38]
MTGPAAPLLSVRDLNVIYKGRGRTTFHALKDICFDIRPGETVGLVGESGSGKTTIGRALLGLVPVSHGTVTFDGRDITQLRRRERRRTAKDVQVVFQDPYSSLNPAMTVEDILSEPLRIQGWTSGDARQRVRALLDQVGLPADARSRRPREFSGGQRQRVAIARALSLDPRLIVCDEPVSALDLTTQARILQLLIDIQDSTGVSYLFISHDLSVVRHISHRVIVLYRGEIVEEGSSSTVTTAPRQEYTRQLLMSAPVPNVELQRARRAARRELALEASEPER